MIDEDHAALAALKPSGCLCRVIGRATCEEELEHFRLVRARLAEQVPAEFDWPGLAVQSADARERERCRDEALRRGRYR